MHEIFEKIMQAFKDKDEKEFSILARIWIDSVEENPFPIDSIEHNLFFKARRYCMQWRRGGIDMRSSRRNMLSMVEQIAERNPSNPYKKEEPVKNPAKKEVKKETEKENIVQEKESDPELKEDVNYLMACMANSYLQNNNASYEMYVVHLMDIAKENPFKEETKEFELFEEMKQSYTRNPPNKRRTFVVGRELCDLINNTELYPEKTEKTTVLGVLPNEKDEKKSWLKFLFPWKKEGEQDDSERSD